MNFFEHQARARRKSLLLLVYFALAVAGLVLAVYGFLLLAGLGDWTAGAAGAPPRRALWHPELFAIVALAMLAAILLGSAWKIARLKGGGAVVARSLGGRPVDPASGDPDERRLLHVVEEMAIASGLPPPPVYLLENEKGINAFAAGFTPEDAVIGVTRGAVRLLKRSELQGVMAHEFSHILHGDMRLNIRLIGVLHGILMVAILGRILARSGSEIRGKGALVLILFGAGLFAIGMVGVFFGRLIKSAVSRQREYLADASAVQFTRHPEGLAGALKKIGGLAYGSALRSPRTEEASHLLFGYGFRRRAFAAMATHPPLKERIRRIDPAFDGRFPRIDPSLLETPLPAPPPLAEPSSGRPPPLRIPGLDGERMPDVVGSALALEAVIEQVGKPMAQHIQAARHMLERLPEELRDTARDDRGARMLVLAALTDRREAIRRLQRDLLRNELGPEDGSRLEELIPKVHALPPALILPLVELCAAGLRRMEREAYPAFRRQVTAMIEADRQITLSEYALRTLLFRNLDPHLCAAPPPRPATVYSLRGVRPESACLLSALARVGHGDDAEVRNAFRAGAAILEPVCGELVLAPAEACGLHAIDEALSRLASVSVKAKRQLVAAALVVLAHDRRIDIREAELFRAVALVLGCPVPPWVVPADARDRTSIVEPSAGKTG